LENSNLSQTTMEKRKNIKHKQADLFGKTPSPKTHKTLSESERMLRVEKSDAHRVFKLLKSNKFTFFTEHDKYLLKKYYNISLASK